LRSDRRPAGVARFYIMPIHPFSAAVLALAAVTLIQPCLASPDSVVSFNEVQYHPAAPGGSGEWIELCNQMGIKVDVSGWRIDGLGYTFPAGTIIEPGAHVVVAKTPAAGQFGPFSGSLNNAGERLRLINHSDRLMDELEFQDDAPWPAAPDGSGSTLAKAHPHTASTLAASWTVSSQTGGTPGTANFPAADAPPPRTTVPVLRLADVWRYNDAGQDLGAGWAGTAHAAGGAWKAGPGALGYETAATVPIGTPLAFPGLNDPYVNTYYFETEFAVTAAQRPLVQALKVRHALDDGAVFYLNGTEVYRFNMPVGPVTAATAATASVDAGTALSADVPLDFSALQAGSNRLSVEVHQFAIGNSDIVFGAELDLEVAAAAAGEPASLRFNELPPATAAGFWVELVNDGSAPLELGGLILSVGGDPLREFALPAGLLAPGALLLLDEPALGFRPGDGEKLFLFATGKTSVIDARAQTGRLRGRAADRGGVWAYPASPTPGQPNAFVFNDSVVISEIQSNPPVLAPVPGVPATFENIPLIGFGDTWRYNDADEELPLGWAAVAHAAGGNWKFGAGPVGREDAVLPVPLATVLEPYEPATVAYYFERDFTVAPGQLAQAESLEVTHLIDDGAVFYLNGIAVGRFNMPEGELGPETLALTGLGDAAPVSLVIPPAGLQAGANRLSVQVHQNTAGSSDLAFGLKLDLRRQLTPEQPALPMRKSDNQWLEIANRSAAAVDLTGWGFADGIDFEFAAGTVLASGEHACVVREPALFAAAYPAARVLGVFGGSLSRGSGSLVLRDALRNTVDEVAHHDGGQWPEFADGGGSSAELRDLSADNMAGAAWAASDESGRTEWRTYTYRGVARASRGPDSQWREFNIGLMSAGEVWFDDFSVIENPEGAATQKLVDGGFDTAAAWRLRGNHRHGGVIPDPDNAANRILRMVATGPTEHMHNQVETTLASAIVNGREYQISFRARWVTGSNQLHSRLYFNRLARDNVIDRPLHPGTPSAPNSRAVANLGPVYAGLRHFPAVPAVAQAVTVSASATDADGVASMSLFYSVNGGAFQSAGMSRVGGRYEGGVPGQTAGAVVQFYLRGTDGLGAVSFFPAGGPESRALYKVNDNAAATNGWHNFRIITTNADRDFMHTPTEVMSNDRIGATVIDRENDIYYGVGVRLKSSQRGRNQPGRVGYNLSFPPDALFRGVHGGVAVDRSEGGSPGQRELLFDVMISNAGGPISRYYDFIKVLSPRSSLTGGAILQMARYEDVFLDSQFENGSEGFLYEYELVYYPTTATAAGAKIPEPDNVQGVPVSNLGNTPEDYRWNFLNKINREADNFAPIMNYAKHFSKSGAAFEAGLEEVVDVDAWLRGMAYAVLTGAGDNAAAGDQHNGIYYARPDGRVIFFPHDMDLGFDVGRGLFGNPQCAALTNNPVRRRLYLGHLHDVINTTFNNKYMSIWTRHFAAIDPRQDWAAELSYMTSRSNNVLAQINSRIPAVDFSLLTPGPLTVAGSQAVLTGRGWVNVRGIRLAGSGGFLDVTWTDASSWQVVVPVPPGPSEVRLEAVDFSGVVAGTATIAVNNTSLVAPAAAANLVVSEIMYHALGLTPAETVAGFVDEDQFEYVEVMNIGALTLDLTGVRFTSGLIHDFAPGTRLGPGARLVVAAEAAAFLSRHPDAGGRLASGGFQDGRRLANRGEVLLLIDAGGGIIKDFAYGDAFPWPVAADGQGASLVLVAPQANPDHAVPENWRSSVALGGAPGAGDAVAFAGEPSADADEDGLNAFLEHAIGTSDLAANAGGPAGDPAGTSFAVAADGHLLFSATRNLAADDVVHQAGLSTDLVTWSTEACVRISEMAGPGGTSTITWRSLAPASGPTFVRLELQAR